MLKDNTIHWKTISYIVYTFCFSLILPKRTVLFTLIPRALARYSTSFNSRLPTETTATKATAIETERCRKLDLWLCCCFGWKRRNLSLFQRLKTQCLHLTTWQNLSNTYSPPILRQYSFSAYPELKIWTGNFKSHLLLNHYPRKWRSCTISIFFSSPPPQYTHSCCSYTREFFTPIWSLHFILWKDRVESKASSVALF